MMCSFATIERIIMSVPILCLSRISCMCDRDYSLSMVVMLICNE